MVERAGVCRYVCVGGRYAKKKKWKKEQRKGLGHDKRPISFRLMSHPVL